MGHHRAERHDRRSRPSETPAPAAGSYVGRRVARPVVAEPATTAPSIVAALEPIVTLEPVVAPTPAAPGKRRAVKHAEPRGHRLRRLPSPPLLLGVATLAIAVVGTLASGTTAPVATSGESQLVAQAQVRPPSALSGESGTASINTVRGRELSRDSDRQALQQASESDLVEAAEAQVQERNAALGQLAAAVEKQAKRLSDDRWVVPLNPVVLTARFGDYGLWANYHTGLDFNGETGDPIYAIAAGVVTSAGYDGSYGNKTVVTLDDGTEIWYAHQTSLYVTVGERVAANQVIGTVGATGNVTGSHLHLEVRPGGGDPVDPFGAFGQHGINL